MAIFLDPKQLHVLSVRLGRHRQRDKHVEGTNYRESLTRTELLEIIELQEMKCFWTGVEMTVGDGSLRELSVDRIHHDLPHVRENVVLCQRGINLARRNSSIHEFVEWLKMMGILHPHFQDARLIQSLQLHQSLQIA